MSKREQADSRHHQQGQASQARERTCPNGHTFLARSIGPCPICLSLDSRDSGVEFTKKVVDDNDLIKSR